MSIVFTWYAPTPTDITADVLLSQAQFTMNSGSSPGQCQIGVKDPTNSYTFKAGQRLTLDIDGIRYWDGYAIDVSTRYGFYVVDTTKSYERVRIWQLRGTDIGLLFSRRVIFNQSKPAAALTAFAQMPAGTSDLSFLNVIMAHLTIADDNITTDFHAVGSPNPDEKGEIISIGDSWGDVMRRTAELPGAVWGMKPNRVVYYEDDSTITAPFAISDEPDDVTSYGYSNYSWTNDASQMVNDAQIWGSKLNQKDIRYVRVEDAASIAAHGRWQNDNGWRTSLYEHADEVAQSIVYGSPEHLHGAKDDSIVVKCRVRQPGLVAGQKVRIISNAFGDDVVLPIRTMQVTFANNHQALFDLTATWDIDPARTFFDYPPFVDDGPTQTTVVDPPPNCQDITANGSVAGDILVSDWAIETSDPKYGEAEINLGGSANATIFLRNRQRYYQSDSNLTLFLDRFDQYDATAVYAYGRRTFSIPTIHYGIRTTISITGTPGVNPRYARMPYDFFGSTIGGQSLATFPVLNLSIVAGGSSYAVVQNNIVGNQGGSLGDWKYLAGAPIQVDWVNYTSDVGLPQQGMKVTVLDGTGASAFVQNQGPVTSNSSSTTADFSIRATLTSSNTGGGGSGDHSHFFDNNFSLVSDTSAPWIFQNYGYDMGQFYSPGPEPGTSVQVQVRTTLMLYTPSGFGAVCVDPTPGVKPSQRYWEPLGRINSTTFETTFGFATGSTWVLVDGMRQRLYYDYTENVAANLIVFHNPVLENAYVSASYVVTSP